MGYATAAGYAEAVTEGSISLEAAIGAHMSTNLYPPPPAYMTAVAVAAVEGYDPEDDHMVSLPEGVTYKEQNMAPAMCSVVPAPAEA